MKAQDFYQELHKIPEPSGMEYETRDFIIGVLEANEIEYELVLDTGILVYMEGSSKDSIAFRADMDGLPIIEIDSAEVKSRNEGWMHACGHDSHMAILLDFILRIKEKKLVKSVLCIFQPAEESKGGAQRIIETGSLERYNVKEIYGLHVWPDLPFGQIYSKPGYMMAQSGELDILIRGKSAHGARANQGNDALLAAAQLVTQAQSIVSRMVAPNESAVLHIGEFIATGARNVVCDLVNLKGTIRAYSDEVFEILISGLVRIAESLRIFTGCDIQINIHDRYKSVYNDITLSNALAQEYFLLDSPVLPAEDFSYYQRAVSGMFFFLGTGKKDYSSPLHSPEFKLDKEVLEYGVRLFMNILEKRGGVNANKDQA